MMQDGGGSPYIQRVQNPGHFHNFGGIDLFSNEMTIQDNSSPDMRNMDLSRAGTLRARGGMQHLKNGQSGRIRGIFELDKRSLGQRYLFYVADDGIYGRQLGLSTWQQTLAFVPTSDLHIAAVSRYYDESASTERNEAVFIANGTQAPMVVWGLTSSDAEVMPTGLYADSGAVGGIPVGATTVGGTNVVETRNWSTNPPSGFARIGSGLAQRLYAFGFGGAEKNRIDYSAMGQPGNFIAFDPTTISGDPSSDPARDGSYFYCDHGDGDEVVGVSGYYGLLIVWKRKSIHIYEGDPGLGLVPKATLDVGLASYHSIVNVGTDIYFWATGLGPASLQAVQEFGDLAFASISLKIQPLLESVPYHEADEIHGYHDPAKLRVIWHCPVGSASENTHALVFYYGIQTQLPDGTSQRGAWSIFDGKVAAMACSVSSGEDISTSETPTIYAGGYDGQIYRIHVDGNQDSEWDGAAAQDVDIEAYYFTPWYTFGPFEVRKRMLWLDLLIGEEGAPERGVYIGQDYSADLEQVDLPLQILGEAQTAYWDSAIWDEALWDSQSTAMRRYPAFVIARVIRFKIVSSGEALEVIGWRAEIRQKGLR